MPTITARLADLVSDVMLTSAHVSKVQQLGTGFVRIEIAGPGMTKTAWTPGDKVQLRPHRGDLRLRTYTPIRWDAETGTTELIGFTHEFGPGARWFHDVQVGDRCEFFGPRRSIDLTDVPPESVFIGDESSVGLACALQIIRSAVSYVFEAVDPGALSTTLSQLALPADSWTVVPKTADRVALLDHAVGAPTTGDYDLVVTGDAATVHVVRRAARHWPRKPRKIKGKAYWAAGRTGLD